jgi:cytochrome c oxidase assembly protein subunit 15
MIKSEYHTALHRLAVLTACVTFPLIFMGGLVTSKGAGLAVPDWPNSYGYNMFTFPLSLWIGKQAGGVFFEHLHRLMGTVAGFCSVALVLFAYGPARHQRTRRWIGWAAIASLVAAAASALLLLVPSIARHAQHIIVGFASLAAVLGVACFARVRHERPLVRRLSVIVLIAVIAQGVLGGLRVILVNLDLAIVHGIFAQAFFCLTALMVAVTSRWWQQVGTGQPGARFTCPCQSSTVRWGALAVGLIFAQLVVGALMRHYDAGLAIPDLPLAYGEALPPTDGAGLREINAWRAWHTDLKPVTMTQIWLHFGHRIGAILVSAAVVGLIVHIRRKRREPLLVRPALLLAPLLITQLTLGVLTVLWVKPADIATFHVALGALTLFTAFTLAARAARIDTWPQAAAEALCDVERSRTEQLGADLAMPLGVN